MKVRRHKSTAETGDRVKRDVVATPAAREVRTPNSELRTPHSEPSTPNAELRTDTPDLGPNQTVLRAYQRRWVKDESRFAIAVKSAQVGYSTATAAWAVRRCMKIPQRTVIFLSRSERQSRELAEKAKVWIDGYQGMVAEYYPGRSLGDTSTLQHEIRFPNRSRIIVLAANPDTARGYTGDVVLDEFAFHKDSQAIFTAVYRQVSLGYHMRILSTPNGQQGKFWELAKQLGLDSGMRPKEQPVRAASATRTAVDGSRLSVARTENRQPRTANPWSGHWCDIFLAVEEGVPLDPAEVKAGCDEDTWLQEYCCQFVSQASEWISPELFQSCVSSEASVILSPFALPLRTVLSAAKELRVNSAKDFALPDEALRSAQGGIERQALYAGWDIARKHDLSVIWIAELVGDVTWTRGVIEMRNTPTPEQVREARSLMPLVRRMVIDKSGMGLVIFENLEREFPGRIEGVQFTQNSKEAMAVLAKRRMEESKVRLPDDDRIRQSFRGVKKTVNAVGQVRFDAEHDARFGHADHWWAFCMAETAAERPTYHLAEVGKLIGRPMVSAMPF